MKRLLPLLLALVMCFGLTGCLSREEQQNRKLALELVNGTSSVEYKLSTGTSLTGQRIYEDDSGLIVYLAGIKGTPRTPQLVLAVKNGTGHDLSMNLTSLSFNNWVADGWVDASDFSSHTASIATISCDSNFALLNLEDIHTLSMDLSIYTSNDFDTVANISLSLDLSDEAWVDDYQVQGISLLDTKDIQIVAESLKNISDQAQIDLYINNRSNRRLRISSSNVFLNGNQVELFLWSAIAPNSRRLLSDELREGDTYEAMTIAPDDELKFRLQITDDDTGTVLDETEVTLHGSDFDNLPPLDAPAESVTDTTEAPVEDTAAAPAEDTAAAPAEDTANAPAESSAEADA